MAARFQSCATGIQWGILNPNECRQRENLNARDGGDSYLTPANMLIDGELPAQPQLAGRITKRGTMYRSADGRAHFEIEDAEDPQPDRAPLRQVR
jgi:hypothetical protein